VSLSFFILLYHDDDSIFMDGRHDVHSTYPFPSILIVVRSGQTESEHMLCFLASSILRAHTPFSSFFNFLVLTEICF